MLSLGLAMRFRPPGNAERLRAIGPTDSLPHALRRALEPGDDFEPIPKPGPHDWLANRQEPGQTFQDFVRSRANRPDAIRSKIYLQPLEAFPEGESPPLERLKGFAEAFFAMEVEILPVVGLAESDITTRTSPYTERTQLLTGDILRLLRRRLSSDAFCLLAITLHDLYPDASWNYVFGQASLRERVAVYSFARYDPRFYGEAAREVKELMLRRSCKVLAHETAHMFGIQHCVFFHCLMNGSNHLAESDARPLHLCPVDLRKLHEGLRFDVAARYRGLWAFHRAVGFNDEVSWLSKRLQRIRER